MPDREKVIKELEATEIMLKQAVDRGGEMSAMGAFKCYNHVSDAIALLKEQEAVEPFHRCIGKEFSLIEDSHYDYCPYCGKPITWAKQEGEMK